MPNIGQSTEKSRIESLDILRGVALLGILLMNIQAFSMPFAAYSNPTLYGDLTGINLVVWQLSDILANGKFITIFSMLFGAGICIFIDNAQKNYGFYKLLHYRRSLILLAFGLLHSYFLWFGDILFNYGLCALFLIFFIHIRPYYLCAIATIILLLLLCSFVFFGFVLPYLPPEELAIILQVWAPNNEQLQATVLAYQGTWSQQMSARITMTNMMHTDNLAIVMMLTFSMMLLGIAFFRWKILSAQRSVRFYINLIFFGFSIGLPLTYYANLYSFNHQWQLSATMGVSMPMHLIANIAMALAYIGIIMLAVQRQWFATLQQKLTAVGRMALTNYIFHTLVCTFIFYGFGLGLYGQVERGEQLLLVLLIWAIQLWLSPIWLKKYRMGPLERVWRTLTYLTINKTRNKTINQE